MSNCVIWVDGPTGVGKDTLIDKLTLGRNVPVIIAADYVLKNGAESNLRKYTTYDTSDPEIDKIVAAHMDLLDHLESRFAASSREDNVVIINRSFLSCWVYNLRRLPIHEKELILESYIDRMNIVSYKNIFLNLQAPNDSFEVLVERIRSRNDDKEIDEGWIDMLHREYSNAPTNFKRAFDEWSDISSGLTTGFLSWLR